MAPRVADSSSGGMSVVLRGPRIAGFLTALGGKLSDESSELYGSLAELERSGWT